MTTPANPNAQVWLAKEATSALARTSFGSEGTACYLRSDRPRATGSSWSTRPER